MVKLACHTHFINAIHHFNIPCATAAKLIMVDPKAATAS